MTKEFNRLLIVDDDAGLRSQLKWAFDGFEISEAQDRKEAVAMVRRVEPDVVLLDLGLPPAAHDPSQGFQALEEIRRERPSAKIIVITGQDDRAIAREAVARGAYDFFAKPPDLDEVRLIVTRAFALLALESENELAATQKQRNSIPGLIVQSKSMAELCASLEKIAATNASAMLIGESGTGKTLLAKALHDLSSRRSQPFVVVDCAAPTSAVDSELFGAEQPTGSFRQSPSKLEDAQGGTLVLDNVGDLDAAIQGKLLRFLQDRSIERIGRRQVELDLRVVSIADPKILDAKAAGKFREDLFQRLAEIALQVPALRDREADAVLLARHFVRAEARASRAQPKKLSAAAVEAIGKNEWPGNVRELQNRVKRAVLVSTRDVLEPADFELLNPEPLGKSVLPTLREERHRTERNLIQRALTSANGNVSEAARMLGVSRPTLYELLRTLEISVPAA